MLALLLLMGGGALADMQSAGEEARAQADKLDEKERVVNVFTWTYYIPDEVVAAFEDASGIARYRVRKTEAQRRLDTTEANMVRIRDVFSEVEAQVGPLAREAEKAKKGIVLLEARRQADISLWLYDSGRLLGEIDAAATTRSHAEFDLSQAQDALQSLEVQNQRLTEMNRGSRETAGQLTGEITAVSE